MFSGSKKYLKVRFTKPTEVKSKWSNPEDFCPKRIFTTDANEGVRERHSTIQLVWPNGACCAGSSDQAQQDQPSKALDLIRLNSKASSTTELWFFPCTSWQHLTAIFIDVNSESSKFTKGGRLCWPSSSWWSYLFGSNLIDYQPPTPKQHSWQVHWECIPKPATLENNTCNRKMYCLNHLFHDGVLENLGSDRCQCRPPFRCWNCAASLAMPHVRTPPVCISWNSKNAWSNLGQMESLYQIFAQFGLHGYHYTPYCFHRQRGRQVWSCVHQVNEEPMSCEAIMAHDGPIVNVARASINLTWSKKTCHTSYIMPVGLVCFIIVAIVNAMLVIRYFRSQW